MTAAMLMDEFSWMLTPMSEGVDETVMFAVAFDGEVTRYTAEAR